MNGRWHGMFFSVSLAAVAAWGAEDGARQLSDEIVAKVDPSVVAIQHERAGGSGFIVSADGHILSNGHVVRGSDPEDPTRPAESITVILNNERKYSARVLGFCMDPDVALLKIEVDEPLQPVEFADSTQVQVGQPCFAVGTPLGLKRTYTSGILSNVERTDLDTFTRVFQTDAAINPGNSGGALFDQFGRVLGINTYASRGANNLGFTIPIHVARVLQEHFRTHGRFIRSDLPIFFMEELYDELSETLGVEDGLLVTYVMEATPAWEAGLRPGDIVVAIDGQPVSVRTKAELLDLNWELTIREPGSPITLDLVRGAPGPTEPLSCTARLEASEPLPKTGRHAGELIVHQYDILGFGYQRLTRLHRLIHSLSDAPGVLVTQVAKVGPAVKADLKPYDIVTRVAGAPTPDVPTFQTELERCLARQDKAIELTVSRAHLDLPTALAPYYDLKGRTVALVVPDGGATHLGLLRRELVADGARVQLVTPGGNTLELDDARTVPVDIRLEELEAEDIDILLLAGNGDGQQFWTDATVLELVRAVHDQGGILAGVGPAALALVADIPELLEKKMTLPREYSAEAVSRGANYSGADVETDGPLVTSTGFDRGTVRLFLKALRRTARNEG